MRLKVVDFEILTKNFKDYVDGFKEIESEKNDMLKEIEPIKFEMEEIIRRSNLGIIADEEGRKKDMESFRQLQQMLMNKDYEFKVKLQKLTDELNKSVYDKLSTIIKEWAIENSIDMVMGQMEVVYNIDSIDATNDILDILKSRDLFVESV
jgi:Skp family chaperone for outer membrane proteins